MYLFMECTYSIYLHIQITYLLKLTFFSYTNDLETFSTECGRNLSLILICNTLSIRDPFFGFTPFSEM